MKVMPTISGFVKEGLAIDFNIVPQVVIAASALIALNTICLYDLYLVFSSVDSKRKAVSGTPTASAEPEKKQKSDASVYVPGLDSWGSFRK